MHRFLLIFTVAMLFFHSSEGQRFDWAFDVESTVWTYDAYCYAITYDSNQDCSYIIGQKNTNFFVRKTSSTGTTLWEKDFDSFLGGQDITHDNQGNIYIVGECRRRTDFDPSPNPADTFFLDSPFFNNSGYPNNVFTLKLNSNGEFVWAKMIEHPVESEGNAIELDDNGNVYIVGVLGGTNFVQKMNPQGNITWQHELGNCPNMGQWVRGFHDKNLSIHGNHLYVIGDYVGSADMDPSLNSTILQSTGEGDNFLVKLDLNGSLVWANSFGREYKDYTNAISVDAQGNIYTSGSYTGWDSVHVGGNHFNRFGAWYYLRKHNPQGQELWINTIPQEILGIDASQNGYLYTTGRENIGVNNTDIIIQKWQTNNTLLWNQQILSSYNDEGLGIAVDADENVYTVGFFEGIVDFDLSTGVHYLHATGRNDGFVLKLAPQNIAIPYLQSLEGVHIYPNPTSKMLRIDLEQVLEEGRLELISSSGQICYQSKLKNSKSYDLDLSEYPSGIYMVRISSKEKTTTLKLIKE